MPEYRDEEGRRQRTYVVYVVELDPAVCSAPRSPCPRDPCDRVPVYVGQTAKTAEERFQDHKQGRNAGRGWVRDYGLHLRKRLVFPKGELPERADAQKAERALLERLGKKGFCVYGGH